MLSRSRALRDAASFLGLWLLFGFAAGTLLLLGPVRWFVNLSRSRGWPDALERGGVLVLIVLLAVGTGAITFTIFQSLITSRSISYRAGVPLLALSLAGVALWFWMQPERLGEAMGREVHIQRFTYGPYPDEQKMRQLRDEGYTIVSLLHPAVVPFEPRMLSKEKAEAARMGVPFISVPMLPWVSGNSEPLQTIQSLAKNPEAKYYVHCYLGRDRIRVVQRFLGHRIDEAHDSKEQKLTLGNMKTLERGAVYALGSDGYLIPFPTEEEFVGYILDGHVRQVVAMFDPSDPEDALWILQEEKVLRDHKMPFLLIPISHARYDPATVVTAVKKTEKLPKPFVVHGFLSPSTGRAPWPEAFLQTYRSSRPALPPSLFREPLEGGAVKIIAPQIAVGPRPRPHELDLLERRGVRRLIYLGDADSPTGRDDAASAASHGLAWQAVSSWRLFGKVSSGGPYYVYGRMPNVVRRVLEMRYGPAVPTE
ncbi:MAG TPA: hypothetical protein VIL97_06255 [Thermoanaerobaculia bacterium]